MFTTIYKIILVLFFVWAWTNNSKDHLENIFSTQYGRSLAEPDILHNEENAQSNVVDYNQSSEYIKNEENSTNKSDEETLQIDKYNDKNSMYLSNMKQELIKLLSDQNDSKITNILQNNSNIQKTDLLHIYDLIKHFISGEKYLQIINKSCELATKKQFNRNTNAEKYYNSLLYLLNTYFYLAENEINFKRLSMKLRNDGYERPKFKSSNYFNISKLYKRINKQFKIMLLKQMIKQELDPTVQLTYKKRFELLSYGFFYPLSLFVISIFTLPVWSIGLTFTLIGMLLYICVHSNYKIIRDVHFVKQIMKKSKLLDQKYLN
ncbi:uncharacterized protein LOC113223127 [Piliocolobus tephrosceles]|uniref:uncharacterized protein LOC111529764 n=1 Tax=Piliocolobus tephrosceles TaxID=591936 RepID=UPI000E6B0C58|nr:uncharacterized protein LOC111529764 [Piliocolobus tephrosceles]XP_026308475.1 uncharacterized protein LOC113223123 [Piliocolobus tephrosceles]XP_026308477.1 uncharacterized protein LOC113223127 [Piliocolobus tephrosceles]